MHLFLSYCIAAFCHVIAFAGLQAFSDDTPKLAVVRGPVMVQTRIRQVSIGSAAPASSRPAASAPAPKKTKPQPRKTEARSLAVVSEQTPSTPEPVEATEQGVDEGAQGQEGPAVDGVAGGGAGAGSEDSPLAEIGYRSNPAPRYPVISRRLKEEGKVVIKVLINEEGRPVSLGIQLSSGSERLDRAALDAIQHWLFVPEQRNGRPVTAWALVPVVFNLTK